MAGAATVDTAVRQAMEARAARQAMVADTGEARGMAEAPVGTVVVRTARRVAAVVIPPLEAADIRVEVVDIRAVEAEATTKSDHVSEVKVRGGKGVLNGTPFLLMICAQK